MYCSHCGKQSASSDSKFCYSCGNALIISTTASGSNEFNLPVSQPRTYAGFWLRLGAFLLDTIILMIPAFVVGFILGAMFGTGDSEGPIQLLSIVGVWLYYGLMESSSVQGTLGKKIVGIKVTDIEGNRISFGRATGRHFSKILSYFILLIGFLMAGFTVKKQALHDMIASCLVVRR